MKGGSPLLLAIGLAAPPVAWFSVQQAAGSAVYFRCDTMATPLGLGAVGLGFAACLGAGVVGLQRWRAPGAGPFAAQLALGLAAIFALANLFTAAAIVLIPPCAR